MLRLAGIVAAAILVVAAAVAAAIAIWLRTYAPLDASNGAYAPGPGVGAVIEPATGSGGKTVFVPVFRRGKAFEVSFTLRNSGHFGVTVEGLVPDREQPPPWIGANALRTAEGAASTPFQPLRLAAGDTAVVVARFATKCPAGHTHPPEVYTDAVQLRYRYVRWFARTQTVTLPFAVTLRCVGGPLAKP